MKLVSRASVADALRVFEILVEATKAGGAGFYPQDIIDDWHRGRTAKGMREFIAQEKFYTLVVDNEVKAYVHIGDQEVVGLFVHPEEQGKGYGKDLLQFALKEIEGRPVKVLATLNAVDFYARHGFTKAQMRVVRRNERDIYVWEMKLD